MGQNGDIERELDAQLPRQRGRGRLAFTNARILTMDGGRAIERGNVVVDDDRIGCVGRCDTSGARDA